MFIQVEVVGISPLLCNAFTDEAAQAATSGDRGSSAAADRGTPREIAERKLYRGTDGEPMIPSPNLLRSIVDGGFFVKIGKKQVTTARSSLVYACAAIDPIEIKIHHKEPWRVDTRPVRIPATGGRILQHRAMFDDWRLSFQLDLDTSIINARLMRQIVDDAGKRIGLGDFRPSTKGPFGRYRVDHWVQEELAPPLKEAA